MFVDEVQFTIKVKDEENGGIEVSIYDMLNELKSYRNLDVYVTGSNSRMLSKDIVERNKLEREDVLNAILDFIASQIGSLTNPTNISNALMSMRNERINSCLWPVFLISYRKRCGL